MKDIFCRIWSFVVFLNNNHKIISKSSKKWRYNFQDPTSVSAVKKMTSILYYWTRLHASPAASLHWTGWNILLLRANMSLKVNDLLEGSLLSSNLKWHWQWVFLCFLLPPPKTPSPRVALYHDVPMELQGLHERHLTMWMWVTKWNRTYETY